jgi:hypothetical protein
MKRSLSNDQLNDIVRAVFSYDPELAEDLRHLRDLPVPDDAPIYLVLAASVDIFILALSRMLQSTHGRGLCEAIGTVLREEVDSCKQRQKQDRAIADFETGLKDAYYAKSD